MKVLITGSNGFIGRNLQLHLQERHDVTVVQFSHDQHINQLAALLDGVDFIFHLAGVNRTNDPIEFIRGNVEFTKHLCKAVIEMANLKKRIIPIIYTSSTQVTNDNAYGRSKLEAERVLIATGQDSLVPVHLVRLPNVFGKWCLPNYNSVVATFCYNISRDLPIKIIDPDAKLALVYIDDVIEYFLQLMDGADHIPESGSISSVRPIYNITVSELALLIQDFRDSRKSLLMERVGVGLIRALYSTYVSYLPVEKFAYTLQKYEDSRGVFVEVFKTQDSGQFSFFTVHPGFTRGGHYHQTKTEKFLVIRGRAQFRFRHMFTGQLHELQTCGKEPQIVETVPGWAHDITNIGPEELLVMIWANEIFDRTRPDTFDSVV